MHLQTVSNNTVYQEFFASLHFCENGDFNIIVKNIFTNDPRGQHKRCGMAILLQNLILQLSKIPKICENKATQKFPSIWYNLSHNTSLYSLVNAN